MKGGMELSWQAPIVRAASLTGDKAGVLTAPVIWFCQTRDAFQALKKSVGLRAA